MLNPVDLAIPKPAHVRFLESDYQILSPGEYVLCAVTGARIPLDELRYWSFDRQEAYIDSAASLKAELAARDSA